MKRRKLEHVMLLFIIVLLTLTLTTGCKKKSPTHTTNSSSNKESAVEYKKIPLPLAEFKRVMGWITKDEILVHGGKDNEDVLYCFNFLSGEMRVIYKPNGLILTSSISPDHKKIFIQLAGDKESRLQVLDMEGNLLQEQSIETPNYLNVNWNASNNEALFLAYYESENHLKVINWQLSQNTFQEVSNDSLTPVWYSDHLYLYVDNHGEFFLTRGTLYLGDTRTGKKTEVSNQASSFFLTNDALITFTPSDFSEESLLLNYQYPFMVDQGFIEVPKMTMNNRLLFPYLTQQERKSAIYGVFPKKAVRLELEAGQFQLGKLDFKESKVEPILDLTDNAPLQISPDGTHFLYGWRLEYLIDLKQKNVTPFFNFPK